ncbi:MAG TPA: alpha/beta hydrolase [Candidatus Krumholzibacteria bacterium]|nr:alpha/beta hydrolase [Candidatus Krumholzibacteria bacterium]
MRIAYLARVMELYEPAILSIPTRDEHPVLADWYAPLIDDNSVKHIIVLSHGFKGHRRWGFIPLLAARLAANGFGALAIDFSHNGRVPEDGRPTVGGAQVIAPSLFRANTIARELDDLAAVLRWIRDPQRGGKTLGLDSDLAIGLWGHSRGGVVSILTALDDDSISALVTWSASAHPDHFTERQKMLWREKGELAFRDLSSETPLALDVQLLDDIERHHDDYAAADRARDLAIPHLIVHGEHDPTVPVKDSYRYYDTPTIRADKKLLRLLTGHTYGYDDGFIASEALENATKATVAWFETYLRAPSESS